VNVLRHPDGSSQKFRVRSLVGLIPLIAVERLELEWTEPFKEFTANLNWFLKNRRELVDSVIANIGDVNALSAEKWSDFVNRCEAIISDENTSWAAKWTKT